MSELAQSKPSKEHDAKQVAQRLPEPQVQASPYPSVLALQDAVGNQALSQLLEPVASNPPFIQAKLELGPPGDRYEQEADRIAQRIIHTPEKMPNTILKGASKAQRKCAACEELGETCSHCAKEDDNKILLKPHSSRQTSIQRQLAVAHSLRENGKQFEQAGERPGGIQEAPAPSITDRINTMRGTGRQLPEGIHRYFEPRFGVSFDSVRIHTNPEAAEIANLLNARAFTVGRDLFFGSGQYAPDTTAGKSLLAHELTHVIQQGGAAETNSVAGDNLSMNRSSDTRVMREGFESTVSICHRVLTSRRFKIEKGGVRIVLLLDELPETVPGCRDFSFGVTLTKEVDWWPDDEIGTCKATTGGIRSFSFGNLPSGTYYLTIWRNFDHPYCCLKGDILVFDEKISNDSNSCIRDKDLSVLDIIHGALDVAGFIPVIGTVADGVNALVYVAEGDWTNAGISAVAMVPAFGDGAKLAIKGGKEVIGVSGKTIIKMGEDGLAANLKRLAKETKETVPTRKASSATPTQTPTPRRAGGADGGGRGGDGGGAGGGAGGGGRRRRPRWMSPREWAHDVAGEVLTKHKASGVGMGARSGQHGTPYLRAGRELLDIAKTGRYGEVEGILPEIREELENIGRRYLERGRELNHPGGKRR